MWIIRQSWEKRNIWVVRKNDERPMRKILGDIIAPPLGTTQETSRGHLWEKLARYTRILCKTWEYTGKTGKLGKYAGKNRKPRKLGGHIGKTSEN